MPQAMGLREKTSIEPFAEEDQCSTRFYVIAVSCSHLKSEAEKARRTCMYMPGPVYAV